MSGGSNIPTIMGINHFQSRYSLLLEHCQIVKRDFDGNQFTEYGNVIEPKIRDYINGTQAVDFEESCDILDTVRINTDGFNGSAVLEIKSTSMIKGEVNEYMNYIVQLLFYMHYKKVDKGILAVYARPRNFDTRFDEERLQVFHIDMKDYEDLLFSILNEVELFIKDKEEMKEAWEYGIILPEEHFERRY